MDHELSLLMKVENLTEITIFVNEIIKAFQYFINVPLLKAFLLFSICLEIMRSVKTNLSVNTYDNLMHTYLTFTESTASSIRKDVKFSQYPSRI